MLLGKKLKNLVTQLGEAVSSEVPEYKIDIEAEFVKAAAESLRLSVDASIMRSLQEEAEVATSNFTTSQKVDLMKQYFKRLCDENLRVQAHKRPEIMATELNILFMDYGYVFRVVMEDNDPVTHHWCEGVINEAMDRLQRNLEEN